VVPTEKNRRDSLSLLFNSERTPFVVLISITGDNLGHSSGRDSFLFYLLIKLIFVLGCLANGILVDTNQRMNLKRTTGDAFEFFRTWTAEGGFRFATVEQRTGLTVLFHG
jgi:hypothetical protein